MKKRDARKVGADVKYEIRRQAVKLHKEGLNHSEIARRLEVHRSTVGGWIKEYKQGGLKAIGKKRIGRPPGSGMQLGEKEQKRIRKMIVDKDPEQMKLSFALWTREAVKNLIKEIVGKELDLRQVGRYLKRWGMTAQRPVKRAYQRDQKKVNKWIQEEYPRIKQKAKEEGGEIQWVDETGIHSHDHRGKGYAPRGKTPVRKHNPNMEKINKISSITNQGKVRFMCYKERFTYQVFHRFLKKLIEDAKGQKIHVIADNLRVHHSRVIGRWLRRYHTLIELHHLPSYCPDLNPDEYFNCDLKTQLAKRPERRQKGKWEETVTSTLHELASQPERIKKYFNAKPIQYAA